MKFFRYIPTFIILFNFANPLIAQRNVLQFSANHYATKIKKEDNKNLSANFAVLKRFGTAPMTVQFKDISDGEPTKWTWNFGDGHADSIQHPLHTYEQPGNYTVKLIIADTSGTSILSRSNYISVVAVGSCDTAAWPLQGDYIYYQIIGNGSGYVSGNNSFGDLAKASFFDQIEMETTLIGGIFDFAVAKKSMASNLPVNFCVWDENLIDKTPGNILAQTAISISQLADESGFGWASAVFFDNPPTVNQSFFMGLQLPNSPGDTLALYTNYDGDTETGNGWEQHNDENWYPYSDSQNSWGINVDHAIFPLVCHATGISNHLLYQNMVVYPIPASDQLNILLNDPGLIINEITLTDITGRVVLRKVCNTFLSAEFDVSRLKSGIYLLTVKTENHFIHQKVMIDR
ncbi:MAG TPA: PKD domain-containing protein [Bacteroidales bacterium]|nr:PKD domain-containing protein [Bacteroidales bacterium]